MLFNSVVFLFFFLITHQVFWRLRPGHRRYWLLVTSLVFYGWWSAAFLLHFVAVILVSYVFIRLLLRERKKIYLWLAITLHLAHLVFFKYTNSVLKIAAEDFGFGQALVWKEDLGLILPLAISFYTFQIVAFIVDVWRGEIEKSSLVEFTVFIMFFPQLIAGPIMRHDDFLPQMDRAVLRRQDTYNGLYWLALGVIKKVLIADEIAVLINPVWATPGKFDTISIVAASLGFSAQVYCDFSGYTDMARGMARLLGYDIPENFFAPFLSTSFAGLWRRWHVTLSTWLRDYLYIPLGGNRVTPTRFYVNVMLVMSLGGIWHGNTYTYFVWGFLHGVFLVVERLLGRDRGPTTWWGKIFGWMIVAVGWQIGATFFRSADLSAAWDVLTGALGLGTGSQTVEKPIQVFQLFAIMMGLQILQETRAKYEGFLKRHAALIVPILAIVLFYLIARIERPAEEFIYFQF